MSKEYNYFPEGISVIMEEGVVHVLSDEILEKYLKSRRGASKLLASEIREEHMKRYGREIDITRASLACEITCHYLVQKLSLRLEKIFGNRGLIRRALRSTAVIDCGEKNCDGNRFVWDLLSFLFR